MHCIQSKPFSYAILGIPIGFLLDSMTAGCVRIGKVFPMPNGSVSQCMTTSNWNLWHFMDILTAVHLVIWLPALLQPGDGYWWQLIEECSLNFQRILFWTLTFRFYCDWPHFIEPIITSDDKWEFLLADKRDDGHARVEEVSERAKLIYGKEWKREPQEKEQRIEKGGNVEWSEQKNLFLHEL